MATVTGITINPGQTTGHYLTIDETVAYGDEVTIQYSGSGSNIKDAANNALAAFGSTVVTNNVEAAFTPADLQASAAAGSFYFDETQRVFDGATAIDSGIYNDFAQQDYWHIYCKTTIADGVPAAFRCLFGGRDVNTSEHVYLGINNTGQLLVTLGGNNKLSTSTFSDGPVAKTMIHAYANPTGVYFEVGGADWGTTAGSEAVTDQAVTTLSYGANNAAGTNNSFWEGTSEAIVVWGSSSDLTAQNKSDLDTWFSSK